MKKLKKSLAIKIGLIGLSTLSLTPLVLINQAVQTGTNLNSINYAISNNQTSKTIINPDEVFYFSTDLTTLDVWDPNGTAIPPQTPNPYFSHVLNQLGYDQTIINQFTSPNANAQGATNEQNMKKLEAMVKKITTIPGADGDVKNKAQAIITKAKQYVAFKTFESRWLASSIPNAEEIWNNGGVADAVSQQFGGIRQFSDIEELTQLKDLIKKWNGITSANVEKITQIKAQPVKQNDLLSDQQPTTSSDVNQVAGDNYNTLVKIATLDMNIEQNYQLEYEIQLRSTSATTQSKLILLNDQGQWKNNSLKTNLISNLDGFGRYDKYESGGAYGSQNYPTHQENFVFKYDQNSNQLELFVRLKQDQVMKNITFNQSLGSPKQFGILDVQVGNNKSSLGLWKEDGKPNSNQNLITKPTTDGISDNQIAKIQFFSTTYQSQPATTKANVTQDPNRKLTWWQLPSSQPVTFDVNIINNLTQDNRASYEVLKQYVNGLPTQQIQQVSFNFDGQNPTQINDGKNQYDFFAPLKSILPTEVANFFPAISKINFTSSVKSQIAKQSMHYSDRFYLFGEVASKTNLDTNKPIEATMFNPLAKIFFEEPDAYKNSTETPKTATSTLEALEQADLKLNVINLMAQVYNLQANNDNLVNKIEFRLDLPIVKYEQRQSIYEKIHTEVESVILNGPALYTKLTKYWDDLAKMIKATFNREFQGEKRYSVGQLQDAQNIFSQWIVGNFEFIPVYAEVENLINIATKIWDDDPATKDNPNPQFAQFTKEHQAQLQAIVAQLLKIQFQAIVNEFNFQQQLPLYDLFVKSFEQDVVKQRQVVGNPQIIFKAVNVGSGLDLIGYQDLTNLITSTNSLLKNQIATLVSLLKYQVPETKPLINAPGITISNQPVTIGQSLFVNPVAINYWNRFSDQALMNWSSSQAVEIKLQQLQIFNTIFKFFGFDFSNAYVDYLNREDRNEPLTLSFKTIWKPDVKVDLETAIAGVMQLLENANNNFAPAAGQVYRSYHLDNLVSGANLIRILNDVYLKLDQNRAQAADQQWSDADVQSQILSILNQNQASVSEQAAWMKAATNISYDFATLSATLSGRDGEQKLSELAKRIATKEVIMAKRILDFIDTDQLVVQRAIQITIIAIALSAGVAMTSASAIALAVRAKAKNLHWSQHQMFMIIMIVLIIVGLAIATTTGIVGIPPLI